MSIAKLDRWAELLLDTGKRNYLINFRDTKTATVEIVAPSPDVLWEKVNGAKDLEVYDPGIADLDNEVEQLSLEDSEKEGKTSREDYIQTYSSKLKRANQVLLYSLGQNPIRTLKNIDKRARFAVEETGVNIAYIAFGFIHWKENHSEYRAPVLLLPVQFSRETAVAPYHIAASSDEIIVNPTFSYKLNALNRYKFPYDDRNIEIDVYIPSICVGIEYDGAYWQKGKVDVDLEKNRILYENGVHLIRIREKGLPALSPHNATTIILKRSPDGKNGNAVIAGFINDALKIIHEQFQNTPFKSEPYLTTEEYLSELPLIYAEIFSKAVDDNICNYCGIGYWNYSKNGALKPENIPANSWAFAYLKCPNGEDIVLPGSWFRLKLDKRTCTHICTQCLFDCLCPFIINCYLQKGYRPFHCQYNLTDNAIKYNRQGGTVKVSVGCSAEGVRLCVADTGIGIPPEHRERIFERFYRVDKSRSKALGGTGLGLSIVKHAARLHDAKIELQSVEGEGTTVTVVFPALME